MIKLNVKHTVISASNLSTLVAGNINSIFLDFNFSEEWDSLVKIAVFTNGDSNVSVTLTSDTCAIPWEVLTEQGSLFVSLRGVGDEGELVICTKNEYLGRVQPSNANRDFVETEEATPTVIDALIADVADLKAGAGGSGEAGGSGADGKSAYEIAVENGFEGSVAEWLASLKGADGIDGADGANGIDGADGADGIDGRTPVKGVDYFTSADKAELVNAVIEALPDGDEVSY